MATPATPTTLPPFLLPWKPLGNPIEQWQVLPTFLIGEFLFYAVTLLALRHALTTSRDNLLIFMAALLGGTANDVFFMALPIVNNFWQAQAVIMLSPRLPLYIPCVYICFMYIPCVAVRDFCQRRRLSRITLAALSGLTSMMFYWPYDLVGGKFLWWTWHDTDPPIRARVLDVAPMSSTLWTLTFVGVFSYLCDMRLEALEKWNANDRWIHKQANRGEGLSSSQRARSEDQDEEKPFYGLISIRGLKTIVWTLWPVCAFSTPLMMVEMGFLNPVEPDFALGFNGLSVGIAVYAAVAIAGLVWSAVPAGGAANNHGKKLKKTATRTEKVVATIDSAFPPRGTPHFNLFLVTVVYAAAFVIIPLLFDPSTHKSLGIHQLAGKCGVEVKDISGNTRHEFFCAKNFDETFDFSCIPPSQVPKDGEEWYTVCGKGFGSNGTATRFAFVFAVAFRAVILVVMMGMWLR